MSARLRGSLVVLLAGVLTACAAGSSGSPGPKPVPELERQWEMSSLGTIPQSWNEHSWLSDSSYKNPTESWEGGTLRLFDAQSGQQITFPVDGHDCGGTLLAPGDTHFTLVTTHEAPDDYDTSKARYHSPQAFPERECSGLAVYDASTGRTAWEVPVGTGPSIVGTSINGNAVIVSYDGQERACFNKEDGAPLAVAADADCAGPEPRARITDEQGGRVRERHDRMEIAELDGVVLVTEDTRSPLVRAYDRETGRTLWVDEVDPDPTGDQVWTRTETYAATSDSLLHIRYEFEEQEAEGSPPVPTFAFISRVDPRTGEELSQVGKVDQGLFLAQVGDMTVMGVDQEDGLDAHLAGFRIPPVG